MEHAALDSMLDLHRLPAEFVTGVLLLLYTPIGLCLFLLRLFIGAHVFLVSCVLPESIIRRVLLRVMSSVLGVFITQNQQPDPSVKIYISNHRTHFDHNALSLIAPCSSSSPSCRPGFLCWARGFLELGAPGSRSQLLESLKHYLCQTASPPLLLFPEEEMTNGRAGLLHFSSWPFSLSDCVQPLSLSVSRPLVAPSVAGSWWLVDLLWTLFIPYTVYHVRWLPAVTRRSAEHDEEYATRVQKVLASSLDVCATRHTSADLAEHMKRKARDTHLRVQPPSPLLPASNEMARRVKEVLPQVPLPVIHKDLAVTGCVDTTITNILEGRVTYVAEQQRRIEEPGPDTAHHTTTIQKGFARRPEDRHLSLQERKEALYDHARRRYLEKFGNSSTTEEAASG